MESLLIHGQDKERETEGIPDAAESNGTVTV